MAGFIIEADEAQFDSFIFLLLDKWGQLDNTPIGFGSPTAPPIPSAAHMQWGGWTEESSYLQGPNPASITYGATPTNRYWLDMWNPAPTMDHGDPTVVQRKHLDFDDIDVDDDWEEQGDAGFTSAHIIDELYGAVEFTTDGDDDDQVYYFWDAENWMVRGADVLMFEARLKLDNVVQSDMIIGLVENTGGLPGAGGPFEDLFDGAAGNRDMCIWYKTDGGANLSSGVRNEAALDSNADAAMVNNTYVRLGFIFSPNMITPSGIGRMQFFVNNPDLNTNIFDIGIHDIPNELMSIFMGVRNGDANPRTMTVDYIRVLQLRSY